MVTGDKDLIINLEVDRKVSGLTALIGRGLYVNLVSKLRTGPGSCALGFLILLLAWSGPAGAAGGNRPPVLSLIEGGRSLWIGITVGAVLGLSLLVYDIIGSIRDNKRKPRPGKTKLEELTVLEKGIIFDETKQKNTRALIAEIIDLAQNGNIRLIAGLKSTLSEHRKAEITVQVNHKEGLSELQEKLAAGLKKEPDLEKFIDTDEYVEEITEACEQKLKRQKLFSAANIQIRKRVGLSCLFFFIPGLGFFLWGLSHSGAVLSGLGVLGFILGVSRLIKVFTIPVLSEEGLHIKNEIRGLLEDNKQELDRAFARDSRQGLNEFYQRLSLLVVHPDFGRTTLREYRKEMEAAVGSSEIEVPEWIDLESGAERAEVKEVFTALMKGIIYC